MTYKYMTNLITDFLNLKDNDLILIDYHVSNSTKFITLEKKLKPHFCYLCNFKMHSKGVTTRTVSHPVLQDGYHLIFKLRQRRWKCTNVDCGITENDVFSFATRYMHTTNLTPLQICFSLKDLGATAISVAKKFNVSDTTVHNYFMQYVDLPRLKLPEILSVDEVFLNIDYKHKYALVLMDFETKQIIDILPSRLKEDTQRYFLDIPISERNNVKYLVCDMYNPYINYTKTYFTRSNAVVDSFHVVAWLTNKLNMYINKVKKKFQKRDVLRLKEKNELTNRSYLTGIESREVYILKNYRWVLLKNKDNIEYSGNRHYINKLCAYYDTYQIEDLFFSLDTHFKHLRDLKEVYINFNKQNLGNPLSANQALIEIIEIYKNSGESIFIEFSNLLKKFTKEITNSFNVVKKLDDSGELIIRRISNGPIESFNRKPKDLKRSSRGFTNFDYTRNRILWANRDDAAIRAVPKKFKEIQTKTDIVRGNYIKNK